ncbi:MAG: hypothetical protein IJT09_02570 [Abditibacteriota bacterium]|nr:hypothetical protein [Abditibacteriota bacterium]
MKKLIVIFALTALASASFGASTVYDLPGGTWGVYREGGTTPEYIDDGDGGVYVYGDVRGAVGLRYINRDGWLINGNAGDVLNISYTVTGVCDNKDGYGIRYYRTYKDYELRSLRLYMRPDECNFDDYTISVDTAGGSTVATFTFTYELAKDYSAFNGLDMATSYLLDSETDGTVTYDNQPAFRVSAPVLTIVRPGGDPEEETGLPEPATAAYALMGFGSLAGIKRRIKK